MALRTAGAVSSRQDETDDKMLRKGIVNFEQKTQFTYLSSPMTGCKAPARRTSFFMLGDEWTKFPITPTCKA